MTNIEHTISQLQLLQETVVVCDKLDTANKHNTTQRHTTDYSYRDRQLVVILLSLKKFHMTPVWIYEIYNINILWTKYKTIWLASLTGVACTTNCIHYDLYFHPFVQIVVVRWFSTKKSAVNMIPIENDKLIEDNSPFGFEIFG